MKKLISNIGYLLIAVTIFFGALFIYQMRATNMSKKELACKEKKLRDVKLESRKSKEIKERITDSEREEKKILRKIPRDKESIFILIKELTFMGRKMGIKDISFTIEGSSKKKDESNVKSFVRGRRAHRSARLQPAAPKLVDSHHFTMSCTAGYTKIYAFIKKVMAMKRIVSLESIEISRDKTLLPYQKAVLKLVTYTFSGS